MLYSLPLQFDYDHYSELISDMKWLEARRAASKSRQRKTAGRGGNAGLRQSSSEERGSGGGREGGEGGREGGEGGKDGGEGEGERELVGFFSAGEAEVSLDDMDDGSEATAKLKVSQ